MASVRPLGKPPAAALVLWALLAVACGPPESRTAVVSGKTVYQNFAVEDVRLEVFSAAGGAHPVTRGRSGYHGSFALRLAPGDYQLTATGSLPGPEQTARILEGNRRLTVPPGTRRVDQVRVELKPRGAPDRR